MSKVTCVLISNKVLKCWSFAGCRICYQSLQHFTIPAGICYLLLHINPLSVVTLLRWYTSTALILSGLLIHSHSSGSEKSTATVQRYYIKNIVHGRLVEISSINLQHTNREYKLGDSIKEHQTLPLDNLHMIWTPGDWISSQILATLAVLAEGSLTQSSIQTPSQPFSGWMTKPALSVWRLG